MFKSSTHVIQFLAFILIFSLSLVSNAYAAKNTVCTITINSSDEAGVFRKFLPESQYRFVELTPKNDSKDTSSDDWFERACATQVQCDILIISGHFMGNFKGSSPYQLRMETLEKDSCNNSCNGILKHPKEVFLFGCNTMATKEKDWRTPEQYLQALLNEGLTREVAEAVVDSRYGGVGFTNRVRMERVFTGVPELNGFYSTDLLGPQIKSQLTSYFEQIGDYSTHLNNISKGIEKKNEVLISNLTHHFYESRGSVLNDNERDLTCHLFNDSASVSDRLGAILNIMKVPETYAKYLPTIERFFEDHPPLGLLEPAERSAVDDMKKLEQIRKMSISIMNSYNSMYLKVPLALMNYDLGIIKPQELDSILQAFVTSANDQERYDLVGLLQEQKKSVTYPAFLAPSTIQLLNDPLVDIRRSMVAYFLGTAANDPGFQLALIRNISDEDNSLSNDVVFFGGWPNILSTEAYTQLGKIYQSDSKPITRMRAFGLLSGGFCVDKTSHEDVYKGLNDTILWIRALATTKLLKCSPKVLPPEFYRNVKQIVDSSQLNDRDDFLQSLRSYALDEHYTTPDSELESLLELNF